MPPVDGGPISSTGSAAESTVSVIVPTYNSLEMLKKCLDSVSGQTLAATRIECLVVDDGSTDETWNYLQERKETWPQLRIFHQANAGRPSVGRNRCIGEAQGTYLYFLDSDDWLGTDALRRMLAAADDHGSDVVLGRGKGVGTKGVNKQTFARTVYDADVIKDHAWRILAPWKLFRASLVHRLDLRFPEDQIQGEDQVFVATCYFNASKITILSDYDYHYVHGRSSMENLSRQGQSLENKLLTTTRMTALIVQHTEPGDRRDALLLRILFRTLTASLGPVFLRAPKAEQDAFLATIKVEVLRYLSDALLDQADDSVRLRLVTAKLGSSADLIFVIRALQRGLPVTVSDGHLSADLSPSLNELLAEHRQLNHPVVLRHRVEDVVCVDRSPRLSVLIKLPQVVPPVDRVQLVGATRDHGDIEVAAGTLDDHGRFVFDLGDRVRDTFQRWSRGPLATVWKFDVEAYSGEVLVGRNALSWQMGRQAPKIREHYDWVELVQDQPEHVTLYRARKGQVVLRAARTATRESAVISADSWPRLSITFPDGTPAQDVSTRVIDLKGGILLELPPVRTNGRDGAPIVVDLNPADLDQAARGPADQPLLFEVDADRMLCQELIRLQPVPDQTVRESVSARLWRIRRSLTRRSVPSLLSGVQRELRRRFSQRRPPRVRHPPGS